MRHGQPALTIVCIATGRYLSYWEDLVLSFEQNCESFSEIQWVLLTDREEHIQSVINGILLDNLVTAYVPHNDWPLPTLLRYKYIFDNYSLIKGRNTLYLDADMKAISRISSSRLTEFFDSNKMTFVQHPGYFRSGLGQCPRNFRDRCSDFLLKIKFGGVGHWERNKRSRAYVPRSYRKKYFCGGTWGGPTSEVFKFTETLYKRTASDLAQGVIATHHDESHLNWFAANFSSKHETPSWCFEPTYRNLCDLEPLIEAVNKNIEQQWER